MTMLSPAFVWLPPSRSCGHSAASNVLCASESTVRVTPATLERTLSNMLEKLMESPAALAAVEAGSSISPADMARETLLGARFLDEASLCKVRVGPSLIAGKGVFAIRDIEEGEIVTCYPGDLITNKPTPGTGASGGVIWGAHVPEEMRQMTVPMEDYAIMIDEEYSMLGLSSLDGNMAYVGHLINDGAMLNGFGSAERYMEESASRANAGHECLLGCHMVTVATRNIAADEEVLVTYSPRYWLRKQRRRVSRFSQALSSFL